MNLTRRDTTSLILAGGAAVALPKPALARSKKYWAKQLQITMNDHLLSGCGGQFTVTGFDAKERGGKIRMASLIRLDWPPGTRQRRFDANGDAEQATFDQMLNQALFSFAKAWPECVI